MAQVAVWPGRIHQDLSRRLTKPDDRAAAATMRSPEPSRHAAAATDAAGRM
jgi:hypothetical protein